MAKKQGGNRRKDRRIRELEAEVAALHKIVADLAPKETIEALLNGLAPLFLGYKDHPQPTKRTATDVMTSIGEPTDGVERGIWFPDIEFDENMEPPEQWPTPGTISGQPQGTMMPQHRVTNGGVSRTDGQPMFQTGSTAPPPESAQE